MIVNGECAMVTVPKNSSSEKKRHLIGSREYRMSFGTGGLYAREARRLLAVYQDQRSWDNVIDQAVSENLLQFKSSASTRRAVREKVQNYL